ncbi:MAG: C-GCAxxG-C-C family protein [Rectinemataceae bacterium]
MTRAEKAVALHNGGSSCSQAVFTVFADDFGLDEGLAHKLSTGLGGGIGRLGLSCGALTGGVLALSLAFGSATGADQDAKMKTYEVVSKFMADMEAKYHTTQCRVLLEGADLWTEAGRTEVKAKGLGEKVCNRMVAEAVDYVERATAQGAQGKTNG